MKQETSAAVLAMHGPPCRFPNSYHYILFCSVSRLVIYRGYKDVKLYQFNLCNKLFQTRKVLPHVLDQILTECHA